MEVRDYPPGPPLSMRRDPMSDTRRVEEAQSRAAAAQEQAETAPGVRERGAIR